MRKSSVRLVVAAVLLCGAAGAGALVWDVERRAPSRDVGALTDRLDPLVDTVADLGFAQAGYVAGGPAASESLERAPVLLRESSAATAELSVVLRSADAARALQTFADATARVTQADARARELLQLGDLLSASQVLFGDSRAALAAMRQALADIRAAEFRTRAAEREAAVRRAVAGVAAIGLVWVVGLLALVRIPREPATGDTSPPAPEGHDERPSPVPRVPVDLLAAADLCSEIARVETTDALAVLLMRMAKLLDAAGAIVWVSAGEELFPVIAQGYDPSAVRRMGPLSLRAENATVDAWHTQRLQVVHGDERSQSAIAAPVCGPAGCVAVFAVELRHGQEDEPAIRAVVTIVAAQLASLVAGWPGASVVSPK